MLWLLGCAPDPEPSDPPAWTDAPVEGLVLARRLLPPAGSGAVEVACARDDDPAEVHLLRGEGDGELVVYGLLADTRYTCALTADGATSSLAFRTDPLPEGLPRWEATGAPGWGAYTLFNHGTDVKGDRQTKLLIVDPEGGVRWYFWVPYDAADLDASWLGDGQVLFGGGYAAPPTIVDLAGQVLAEAPPSSTGRVYHHVAERIATGEIASLAVARNGAGEERWNGATIEVLDPTMTERTWVWDTQRGADEGWLPIAPPGNEDPYHLNAVAFVGDAVYANFRDLSQLVKLDRATGERRWTLGPGGDFALLDETGAPAAAEEGFHGAHAPELEGDLLLVYDNGVGRPGGSYSRVLELRLDEDAMTAQVVWDWTEPGWYEPIWGDVDRLPNGHVLVTRAHCEACASGEGTTQLVEVDPATDAAVWRLVQSDPHDAGYRAERLDGCAIFANAKVCPALRE